MVATLAQELSRADQHDCSHGSDRIFSDKKYNDHHAHSYRYNIIE